MRHIWTSENNAYDCRGTNSNFHKMTNGTLLLNNNYTKVYWDLLRWGIAHEVLNGDIYGAPFPGSKRTSVKPGGRTGQIRQMVGEQLGFPPGSGL